MQAGFNKSQHLNKGADNENFIFANNPRNLGNGWSQMAKNEMRDNSIAAQSENPGKPLVTPIGSEYPDAPAYRNDGPYPFSRPNSGFMKATTQAMDTAKEAYDRKRHQDEQIVPQMQAGIGWMPFSYVPKPGSPKPRTYSRGKRSSGSPFG